MEYSHSIAPRVSLDSLVTCDIHKLAELPQKKPSYGDAAAQHSEAVTASAITKISKPELRSAGIGESKGLLESTITEPPGKCAMASKKGAQ